MSYIKTTWVTGDIVTAPRMNNMEGGIYNNDAAITELQSEVTDTQSDVSTLQTNVSTMQTNVSTLQSNVSTLQTNVTNLQTITGNLVPSIADVFSTSSTYAVGDHVMYNGRLYECKTAVTSAGAWNASAWEAVSVFKYDDVVGVIKITNTSTTMATIETTLAEINTANDHIVFDVSALSAGMHLCTIYLSDGKYRITDLATGFDGEGLYSGTDTLVSILQKGSAPFYNVSTEPYTFRPIESGVGNKEALDKLIGGSLAWNQLNNYGQVSGTNNGVTYTKTANGWTASGTASSSSQSQFRTTTDIPCVSGHRYLCIANAVLSTNGLYVIIWKNNSATRAASIGQNAAESTVMFTGGSDWTNLNIWFHVPAGKTASNTNLVVNLFDLTATFGSTIAEYIYSLESATAGSGIAWLSKYIDLTSYHAYDAGSIQSVQATAHVTTGFNQWDEVWELGSIAPATGQDVSSTSKIRSKNYIPVLPNTTYHIHVGATVTDTDYLYFYDGGKNFISSITYWHTSTADSNFTIPINARYMRFIVNNTAYNNDICINISKTTGSPKNGDYVPYNGHSYPLGSDTLRGIPQLVSNKLVFDGDEKYPDGTTRRKYGIVDLGSLNWARETSANSGWRFYSIGFNLHKKTGAGVVPNMICPKYITVTANQTWNNVTGISNNGTNPSLTVCDTAYSDAASFKTAMSGVYLVYELESYTTEFLSAYQRVQEAPQGGTEAFTTESIVPVGHSTRNPGNMLAAVELVGDDKEENPIYSEDSTPYTLRKVENRGVAGKCALNKLVGGSLGWNQLVENKGQGGTSNGVTATNNNDGTWTFNGTYSYSGQNTFFNLNYYSTTVNNLIPVIKGHKYLTYGNYSEAGLAISFLLPNLDAESYVNNSSNFPLKTPVIFQYTGSQNVTLLWRYQLRESKTFSNVKQWVECIDLTQAFGSTIADYVYGLEQATAGAGVAWLSKYIDLSTYHAYDAGSIQSVQATAHITTGKNLIDQTQFVQGSITGSGVDSAVTIRLRSPFVKVSPNTQYSLSVNSEVLLFEVHQYDANKNWLGYLAVNATSYTFTTRSDAEYIKLLIRYSNNATIVVSALTALQMQFGSTATTYEPYTEHVYPLGSDTLRGYPMLVNNKLAFDGDEKLPDGTIRRKYNTYTATTCTNVGTTTAFGNYAVITDLSDVDRASGVYTPLVCDKYLGVATSGERAPMTAYIVGGGLVIADPSFTDLATARSILASKTPQIVYKTITQTTESSTSFQKIQTIDADGTESFTTSSPVPVGHYTQYAENTLAEIDAIGDGLDDIGEEKAVAIPNSAITIVESGASIVENGLHIYKNMVSGWLVIKRGTGYAQTSTHIATIDSRYVPKTRQRMVAGEGYNAYDVQGVAYTTIPPQGSADAGQLWAIQNSTSRPHLFIHLDYTI